jgi:hypothetical protein
LNNGLKLGDSVFEVEPVIDSEVLKLFRSLLRTPSSLVPATDTDSGVIRAEDAAFLPTAA